MMNNKGLLKPDELTKGGDRRYKLETLKAINHNIVFNRDDLKTIAYARVSSHDQKDVLVRKFKFLNYIALNCQNKVLITK